MNQMATNSNTTNSRNRAKEALASWENRVPAQAGGLWVQGFLESDTQLKKVELNTPHLDGMRIQQHCVLEGFGAFEVQAPLCVIPVIMRQLADAA